MTDLEKLTDLQVSLLQPGVAARLEVTHHVHVCAQLLAWLSHMRATEKACRMFAMGSCHPCSNAGLHVQYEQRVAKLKATKGLTQLSTAGLHLASKLAAFSQWRAPDHSLRKVQQESAFEALKDDMVSRPYECASPVSEVVDNVCVLHVSNVGIAWMAYTSSQE